MPNMISGKRDHSLVVANEKLFAIGFSNYNCEVYDSSCGKFVALKSPPLTSRTFGKVVSIGGTTIIIQGRVSHLVCFDVDQG